MSTTQSAPDTSARRGLGWRGKLTILALVAGLFGLAFLAYFVRPSPVGWSLMVGATIGLIIWWKMGFLHGLRTASRTVWIVIHLLLSTWPIILIGAAYLFGVMHQPFHLPLQDNVKDAFIIFGVIGAVCALISSVASFVMVSELMIIVNLITSILWFGFIFYLNGKVQEATGHFEYWALIPLIMSGIECIACAIGGTHNAWNKNPTMVQGRTTL